jgi:hypothetical protein
MTAFDKIKTTREQYIVAQILGAALKSVNSLHCASEGEVEAVNADSNCIDKIACNVAQFAAANLNSRLLVIQQTIDILERAKVAASKGGLTLK